jgi:dolichol kinase
MEESLSQLIEKTEGLQPWRRVFHAASGTALVLALLQFPLPQFHLLPLLGAVLLAQAILDGIRLTWPSVNRHFFAVFSRLASPREARGVASSTWYTLGILLALALFPRAMALGGILVLALADPAASYLGQRWGKRNLGRGTVEGSILFAIVAFAALCIFAPWPQALGAALVTTVIEGLPWPVDDNLSVPLAAAGSLMVLL